MPLDQRPEGTEELTLNLGTGAPDRGVSRVQQGRTGDLLYFILYGTLVLCIAAR